MVKHLFKPWSRILSSGESKWFGCRTETGSRNYRRGLLPWLKAAIHPLAAMSDLNRNYFGVQFHPEVRHTLQGKEILGNFVLKICQAKAEWTPVSIIQQTIERVHLQVKEEMVLSAVSGGVDSTVAAALVQKAVGDQLTAVFVDTGLLRQGEALQVRQALEVNLGVELITVDAAETFFSAFTGSN